MVELRHVRSNKYLSVVKTDVCFAAGSHSARILIDLEHGHSGENIPIPLEDLFTLESREGFLNIKESSKFKKRVSQILVSPNPF